MDAMTSAARRLLAAPGADFDDEVERLATAVFRDALLAPDDEELPADQTFFELGLTSLRMVEVRERLEEMFGVEIATVALFDHPTIDGLSGHLVDLLSGAQS